MGSGHSLCQQTCCSWRQAYLDAPSRSCSFSIRCCPQQTHEKRHRCYIVQGMLCKNMVLSLKGRWSFWHVKKHTQTQKNTLCFKDTHVSWQMLPIGMDALRGRMKGWKWSEWKRNNSTSCTDQGQGCHKLWSTINSTLNMRLKTGGFHPNETILFSKRTRTCLSKHPRTTGARTCAVRHAFASCINRLLALLLGSLKMTVFTARTVPITAEEQTGTVQVKGQPHSKPAV